MRSSSRRRVVLFRARHAQPSTRGVTRVSVVILRDYRNTTGIECLPGIGGARTFRCGRRVNSRSRRFLALSTAKESLLYRLAQCAARREFASSLSQRSPLARRDIYSAPRAYPSRMKNHTGGGSAVHTRTRLKCEKFRDRMMQLCELRPQTIAYYRASESRSHVP